MYLKTKTQKPVLKMTFGFYLLPVALCLLPSNYSLLRLRLIQRCTHFQADSTFLNFEVAARTYFQ